MNGMTCRSNRLAWVMLAALLLTPAAAPAVDYAYDGLDRLIRITYDEGVVINYRYDAAGNILMVWTGTPAGVESDVPDVYFLAVGAPAPNPFNARVKITLEIKATQNVALKIYDVRGYLVRTLIDESFQAGVLRVIWDGRDDRGANVASGLYLAQVRTDHAQQDLRMMLVK